MMGDSALKFNAFFSGFQALYNAPTDAAAITLFAYGHVVLNLAHWLEEYVNEGNNTTSI